MTVPISGNRRSVAIVLAALLAYGITGPSSDAQSVGYPAHPVRLVVPFPAGGGADTDARAIAERLSVVFGQRVLVENRAGASGIVGVKVVARAAPDGYTLLLLYSGHLTALEMAREDIYVPKAFKVVAKLNAFNAVLVVPVSSPIKSVDGLARALRESQGRLKFGSAGNGTGSHLDAAIFMKANGELAATHIPYKGAIEMLQPLIHGDLDFAFPNITTAFAFVRSQRLRALAVTGEIRASALPDVPTFRELGSDVMGGDRWTAIAVPSGTPENIVETLRVGIQAVKNDPAYQEFVARLGASIIAQESVEKLQRDVAVEADRMRHFVRTLPPPQ